MPISAPAAFEIRRFYTILRFLSDPRYSGNHAYAGWRLLGHPGPHHRGGYTPAQMQGEEKTETPWGEEV